MAAALKAGALGTSVVRFTVSLTGRLLAVEVVQSSGPTREHRLLDHAFVHALVPCPFLPGRDERGRATGAAFTVRHVWELLAAAAK